MCFLCQTAPSMPKKPVIFVHRKYMSKKTQVSGCLSVILYYCLEGGGVQLIILFIINHQPFIMLIFWGGLAFNLSELPTFPQSAHIIIHTLRLFQFHPNMKVEPHLLICLLSAYCASWLW